MLVKMYELHCFQVCSDFLAGSMLHIAIDTLDDIVVWAIAVAMSFQKHGKW